MQLDSDRRPGFFITLEGPDGSGKSTQALLLGQALRAGGFACTVTREPGGTKVGEAVREILLHSSDLTPTPQADALLFSAARAQHVAEVIAPALDRGEVVVCDRFLDSTLVYQGYGSGLPLVELAELERFTVGDVLPDMTILVDIPIEQGLVRKTGDEITRFEERHDLAYHRRVREGFYSLAASEPRRWVIVDATRPVEVVASEILVLALRRLVDWKAASAKAIESGAAASPTTSSVPARSPGSRKTVSRSSSVPPAGQDELPPAKSEPERSSPRIER